MANRYLTTTLPYVNSDPHVGHALELVQADALVRFWKLQGDEVFFNTGTDEHGQKIFEAAQKAGKEIQAYVDYYANEFKKLNAALGLSDDLVFIRTTDPHHLKAAQEMWKRCAVKGDIYKKEFEGLYCVGCEKFLTEREIVDGVCHIHGTKPELLKEENYFFRLSCYKEKLLKYLDTKEAVVPEWRREEAINFVNELEDVSISREKVRLSWGIPVPNDDSQLMYVWFEALVNYISTLGWPNDQVFYHGFINSGGQKMSKSLGNVISPYDLVKKYGTEATRYLLLRHVHSTEDTDVTWERLDEWYTAGLVNGLGNLVARVMKMAETYLSEPQKQTILKERTPLNIALAEFGFQSACNYIWFFIQQADEKIAKEKPFDLVKTDKEQAKLKIAKSVEEVSTIGQLLAPFMPETSKKILEAIKKNKKPENLFPRLS